MLLLTSFLSAMFAAVILIPPLTALYQKLNIVDLPSARKVHSTPIPRVGGVAIVIASVLPMYWWLGLDKPMIGVFLGIATIFVMGVLDDTKDLDYKIKFILQALSIALIFYFGYINIDNAEFNFDNALLNTLLLIIYFVFILGVTNAINLADGLDGLAGGVSLLSFSIIGLLAYESDNTNILVMVVAVIGAVFGFLRFNSYPAKIFMGDTGSLFLGFILGLLSISLTYAEDSAYAKMLPLLLVGLPLFDTAMVFMIRLANGKSPFQPDRNHFHHRLLDHGLKHYQCVLLIYIMQSIFVLTAYYMRYSTELGVILAFITLCLLLVAIGFFRWESLNINHTSLYMGLNRVTRSIKDRIHTLSPVLFLTLSVLLFVYVITSALFSGGVDIDIRNLLIVLLLLTLILFTVLKNKALHWVERIIIHVMIVLCIYFSAVNPIGNEGHMQQILFVTLLACALLAAMLLMGGVKHKFAGSPLDFLLIATAIVIPNLPGSPVADSQFSFLLFKLVILFYCFEYVISNMVGHWWLIRVATLLFFVAPLTVNYLS